MSQAECPDCGFQTRPGEECDCAIKQEEELDQEIKTDVDSEEYQASLPPGWRVRELRVGFGSIIKRFVGACGKEYHGRIAAIRRLARQEGREEDIAILRQGLTIDGWMEHSLLPYGWWAKPVTTKNEKSKKHINVVTIFRFFTDKNEWFVGIKKAVKYLQSRPEDLENLHKFTLQYKKYSRSNNAVWLDGSEFLPEGWRYRICHGTAGDYAKLLSPTGETFGSRCRALAHMVSTGYAAGEVETMRAGLVYDGWQESALLPTGWNYRKCKSGRNEYNFLSPDGEVFPSKVALTEYFSNDKRFSQFDIDNLKELRKSLRAKWLISGGRSGPEVWVEGDPSVPQEWKVKHFDLEGRRYGKPRHYLLSPEGALFQTRARAMASVVENGGPQELVVLLTKLTFCDLFYFY